jgi:predicted regulator of amino acid metabolism with ACT domain
MAEDPSFGKQHKELKSLSETGTEAKKLAKQREKRRQKKRAQKAKHKATKAQQVKLLTDGDSFYLSDDDDDDEDDMENELLGIALFTPCAFKLVIQAALATQNKSLVLSRLFSALKPVSSVSKPKVHVTTNLLRTLLALEKIEIRNVHSKDTNNTNNSFNIVVQSTKYIPSQHGYVLIPVQVILDLRLGNHPDPLLVDVFGQFFFVCVFFCFALFFFLVLQVYHSPLKSNNVILFKLLINWYKRKQPRK